MLVGIFNEHTETSHFKQMNVKNSLLDKNREREYQVCSSVIKSVNTYLMSAGQGSNVGLSVCLRWGKLSLANSSFSSASVSTLWVAGVWQPVTRVRSCSRNWSCRRALASPWMNRVRTTQRQKELCFLVIVSVKLWQTQLLPGDYWIRITCLSLGSFLDCFIVEFWAAVKGFGVCLQTHWSITQTEFHELSHHYMKEHDPHQHCPLFIPPTNGCCHFECPLKQTTYIHEIKLIFWANTANQL